MESAESLFRALRSLSSQDTPEDHRRRIQVARSSLSSGHDLDIPRRGLHIFEWAIERLLKTRQSAAGAQTSASVSAAAGAEVFTSSPASTSKILPASPVLDELYWRTVHDLLQADAGVRRELKHILTRIPTLPTLSSFIACFPDCLNALSAPDTSGASNVHQRKTKRSKQKESEQGNSDDALRLLHAVVQCYKVMLPAALAVSSPSASLDALLACIEPYLVASDIVLDQEVADADLQRAWVDLGALILDATNDLTSSSDRSATKKLSAFFLDKALSSYLACYSRARSNTVEQHLLRFPATLLYNSDNLARIFPSTLASTVQATQCLSSEIFSALRKVAGSAKTPAAAKTQGSEGRVLAGLPALFFSFADKLRTHSKDVFAIKGPSTSSRTAAELAIQNQYRHAVFAFLSASMDLFKSMTNSSGSNEEQVAAVSDMLLYIENNNLYIAGPAEANRSWLGVLRKASKVLTSHKRSEISAFCTLARLDFMSLEEDLPHILQSVAATGRKGVGSDESSGNRQSLAEDLIRLSLAYYGKTRQLPELLSKIQVAVASELGRDDNLKIAEAIFKGSLLSIATRRAIEHECAGSLSASQADETLRMLLESCQEASDAATSQAAREANEGHPETPAKKKRRMGDGANPSSIAVDQQSVTNINIFQATVQLATAAIRGIATTDYHIDGSSDDLKTLVEKMHRDTSHAVVQATAGSLPLQRCAAVKLGLAQELARLRHREIGRPPQILAQLRSDISHKDPLLVLELLRPSLETTDGHASPEAFGSTFEVALQLLHQDLSAEKVWSGYLHDLDRFTLPVVLFNTLVDSNMSIFELHATETQVKHLVAILLQITPLPARGISPAASLARLLQSAAFLECRRIRAAFQKAIIARKGDLPHLPALLSLLPRQYFDSAVRRQLVQILAQQEELQSDALDVLYEYTRNDHGSPLLRDRPFMAKVAESCDRNERARKLLEQMLHLLFQTWNSQPGQFTELSSLVDLLTGPLAGSPGRSASAMSVLDALTQAADLAQLPDEARSRLTSIMVDLRATTATPSASLEILADQVRRYAVLRRAEVWLHGADSAGGANNFALQALSVALNSPDGVPPALVFDLLNLLASNIVPANHTDGFTFTAFCASAVALLKRTKLDQEDHAQLSLLMSPIIGRQAVDIYADAVDMLVSNLSTEDVVRPAVLDVLQRLICYPPEAASKVAASAFSATLRKLEELGLATRTVPQILSATALVKAVCDSKIGMLELLDVSIIWCLYTTLCKPASALQAAFPLSAQDQANSAASRILSNILGSTSVLAQQRRDLLIPTFHQFAQLISSLFLLLRASSVNSSPATSAAQLKQASASFPSWILSFSMDSQEGENSGSIIDRRHGQAMSRLLTGLNTKTLSTAQHKTQQQRKGRNAQQQQQQEFGNITSSSSTSSDMVTLTGPMSKHSPFMLLNYLRAATDSTFPISYEVRRVMLPGVLDLFGTMGKFEREALMRGFMGTSMEAERALLRQLLKEHDRVRYRGD